MRSAYPAEHPCWIDLLDPTPAEVAAVEQEYRLRIPTRAQLEEIETSSRLRAVGETLYLSMPLSVIHQDQDPMPTPVGFILSSAMLITLRYAPVRAFARASERASEKSAECTAYAMFATLIEEMVDVGADLLEKIAAELGAISRTVFQPKGSRTQGSRARDTSSALRERLTQVGDAGEHLSQIRETLVALQRISGYTAETAAERLPVGIQTRLKTVRSDLASLTDFESHLSGKVQFLLDAILGFINTEQNEIFKVLTIASVVGIPPTLIASMYGMNFHSMPELGWRWGYAYGLGVIALSALIPILWFKWRGWW
jgi:magnesium transporter